MTLLLIIASAIFTLVTAYYLVLPFLTTHEESLRFEILDEDLRKVEELAARKSSLLQTLRDVKFDFETSKISERDYRELKRRYESEAVEVMRALDDLHGGRGWEAAIDAELDQRLAQLKAERGEARPKDVSLESIDCPDCGHEMEADARFCSNCGISLDESAPDESAPDESELDESELNLSSSGDDDDQSLMESRALSNSGTEVAT